MRSTRPPATQGKPRPHDADMHRRYCGDRMKSDGRAPQSHRVIAPRRCRGSARTATGARALARLHAARRCGRSAPSWPNRAPRLHLREMAEPGGTPRHAYPDIVVSGGCFMAALTWLSTTRCLARRPHGPASSPMNQRICSSRSASTSAAASVPAFGWSTHGCASQ